MNTEEQSSTEKFTGTMQVQEKLKFPEKELESYLNDSVSEFEGPLEVREFKGGQSNPTYQLVTPKKKYVLRRKPPGKLLPSAHAVDREYKVITALNSTGFPVPKTYTLCMDESVIGTIFYVMEMVEGNIYWEPTLPECDNELRNKIYREKNKTLADLHNTNYKDIGLEDFGKPGNYFSRQIIQMMMRIDTVNLVNLITGNRNIPECIGTNFNSENLFLEMVRVYSNNQNQVKDFTNTMVLLGENDQSPNVRAAHSIIL